jgi:hypothetical protein
MKLYRTRCSSDWKGRPTHSLELVATGDKEALKTAMDLDVRQIQASDVLVDQEAKDDYTESTDKYAKRLDELVADPKLSELWTIERERFEMRLIDCEHRELAWSSDGDRASVVYHFREDWE